MKTMENSSSPLTSSGGAVSPGSPIPAARRMGHLSAHFFAGLGAKIAAMNQAGVDVIRLDEGSPDLPPAPHIIQTLAESAARPDTHSYQPHRGSAALRQAWAGSYQQVHQVELDAETEILPLLGSKEGIFHLSQAFLQPGDLALIPDPGYISYTRGALFAGAEPYTLPLAAENDYLPDFSALSPEIIRHARLLWLNYPNNPTAAVASQEFFAQAVTFARQHHILLVHDAAYARITFDGKPAPSLLAAPGAKEVAVEFNTLSKSHNMAGWRSGVLAGNAQVIKTLFTLKTNADSGHFRPILDATIAALTGDQTWVEARNQVYRRRRDILVQGLRNLGFPVQTPQASLYVWCPVPQGHDSLSFSTALLDQAGLSLTPGTVFGPGGEGFVRISITAPEARLQEAVQRLADWRGA